MMVIYCNLAKRGRELSIQEEYAQKRAAKVQKNFDNYFDDAISTDSCLELAEDAPDTRLEFAEDAPDSRVELTEDAYDAQLELIEEAYLSHKCFEGTSIHRGLYYEKNCFKCLRCDVVVS